jgi:hypothetical protein
MHFCSSTTIARVMREAENSQARSNYRRAQYAIRSDNLLQVIGMGGDTCLPQANGFSSEFF